jgi:hypothetical protein
MALLLFFAIKSSLYRIEHKFLYATRMEFGWNLKINGVSFFP